jgi:hypothetical protein
MLAEVEGRGEANNTATEDNRLSHCAFYA